MDNSRRKFLKGAAGIFACAAVVKSGVLMPVKQPIWQPGEKLVSGNIYFDDATGKFFIDSTTQTLGVINHLTSDAGLNMLDLYHFVKKARFENPELLAYPPPMEMVLPNHAVIKDGWSISNFTAKAIGQGGIVEQLAAENTPAKTWFGGPVTFGVGPNGGPSMQIDYQPNLRNYDSDIIIF